MDEPIGTIRFSGEVMDQFVAPECSTLTACNIPDLPEPPDYWGSYFSYAKLAVDRLHRSHPLIVVFLRRYCQSVREFNLARAMIANYIAALPQTNNVGGYYLRALSHFEQAVSNLYLAFLAHNGIAKILVSNNPNPFRSGDGSPIEALNQLYSASKHFDKDIAKGIKPAVTVPIWIIRDGLKCFDRSEDRIGQHVVLSFSDMVTIYNELGVDAKFIAVDTPRLVLQRRDADKS